jgi:hypothetical protein
MPAIPTFQFITFRPQNYRLRKKQKEDIVPVELKELSGGRILEARVTGKLGANDYQDLAPVFDRLIREHGRIGVLLELHDFHGWTGAGLWRDIEFDAKHFAQIERLAIVGEKKWQAGMAAFCKPFTTAQIRFFTADQIDGARRWIGIEPEHTVAVALFANHHDAEAAVIAFQKAGYDMTQFSIIGQDVHTEQHITGYYDLGARMKMWGKLGAFWGGVWGLLIGIAYFFIPGFGPVLIGGPFAASLVAAMEGAAVVGGFSALGAALYTLGIPRKSVLRYETEIKAGKFLLLLTAPLDEIQRAENEILKYNSPEEFALHERPSPREGEHEPPRTLNDTVGAAL